MRHAIHHLKRRDPVLARIISTVGPYTIAFLEPNYETLVRSIIYQQLSGKAAVTIFERLRGIVPEGRITPDAILRLRPARMRAAGLSGQKIAYIRDLAAKAQSGEVPIEQLPGMPDHEVMAHLTAVKGIGTWTVQMFLIFALRRTNVLPAGDLGIRVAVKKAYGLDDLPAPRDVEAFREKWHPYCTVACWYLWRSLEDKAGL